MAERGLTDRLKNSLYSVVLAGSLALGSIGCGDSLAPTPQPPKPQPSLSQTVSLSNFVDINYGATLTNVASATRKTLRDGNSFGNPTTISIPQYNETFNGMQKGNYSFLLEAPNVNSHTATIDVPNYDPTADQSLDSMDFTLDERYEGSQKTFDLKGVFTDKNPEDNSDLDNDGIVDGVRITNATSLDGKTQVSTNGYELTIKAIGVLGLYEVKLDFGSQEGGLENTVLTGEILAIPEQIAFWSRRDDNGGFCDEGDSCNEDIYLINEDRTGEVRLTTHPGQDLEPAWSPDGKEILFTSHRTGGTAVWRMNADGINQRDITSNIVERARQADWCSNGLIVVAYRDKGDSEAGIGIIDLNANSFTPIYSQPNMGGIPEWPSCSPDASEIAFTRHVGNWEVYKMNADGSDLTNITNNPAIDGIPDWSPDGKEIVFRSYRSGTADIYRMNSDGSDVIPLTSALGIETEPKYSADGIKIIFTHDIDLSNPQIYIMNSDGTGGWALLTTQGQNAYPAWRT